LDFFEFIWFFWIFFGNIWVFLIFLDFFWIIWIFSNYLDFFELFGFFRIIGIFSNYWDFFDLLGFWLRTHTRWIRVYGFGVAARLPAVPHQKSGTFGTSAATSTPRWHNRTQTCSHNTWGGQLRVSVFQKLPPNVDFGLCVGFCSGQAGEQAVMFRGSEWLLVAYPPAPVALLVSVLVASERASLASSLLIASLVSLLVVGKVHTSPLAIWARQFHYACSGGL
jgi:hypothetical protein